MDTPIIQTFNPATDSDSFRAALGTFVTGVTIVTTEHFAGSRRFAVHVLAADQRDICAKIIDSKTAISDVPTHLSHCGMPIIEGALASFECNLEATHDAGDHVIVVGLVTKAHQNDGTPLVFHKGKFGEFTAT